MRLNYDWTISPNVINHMGAGLSRFRNPNFSLGFNEGAVAALGLRGVQFDLAPTVESSQGYTRLGRRHRLRQLLHHHPVARQPHLGEE